MKTRQYRYNAFGTSHLPDRHAVYLGTTLLGTVHQRKGYHTGESGQRRYVAAAWQCSDGYENENLAIAMTHEQAIGRAVLLQEGLGF